MPEPTDSPAPTPAQSSVSGFSERGEQAVERRSLRDYYIILRERLWIALPLAIIVAVGFGYYKSRETPMYQATAELQFPPPERVVLNTGVRETSVQSDIALNNNVRLLGSSVIRDRVEASLTEKDKAILRKPFEGLPNAAGMGLQLGSMSTSTIRDTSTVLISVTHQGAEAAALVANRFMDEFIKYKQFDIEQRTGGAVGEVAALAAAKEADLKKSRQAVEDFKAREKFTSPGEVLNTISARISAYSTQLTTAKLEVGELENHLKQIAEFRASKTPLYLNTFVGSYPPVSPLLIQINQLKQDIGLMLEKYLAQWPALKEAQSKLASAEAQLEIAATQAEDDLKSRIARLNTNIQSLQDNLDREVVEQQRMNRLNIEFSELQRKVTEDEETLSGLARRRNELATNQQVETVPIDILNRAYAPGAPYTPNISRIIRTSLGLGVLVFIGIAVGLSFIDDRIKSAWDVEHFVGVDLLGIIPDLSGVKDEDKYSLVLNDSQAHGTESFLSVYSSVKIHSKLDFPKSLLVTSTIPGEGKTLISCNLAGSFARHGKRTLLVDCDLRRPMLHRHFRQTNNAGVITWFEAGGSLEGDLTQDPTLGIIKLADNLSLLCSGGRSKVPTEILESPQFAQLLTRLKKMYDLVVVDSPPLGAVTDSLLIAERADEVIYVCRFNRAYRKHIRMYVKALRNGKNEILGVVLNGLSPRRIEYYSNYRYYRSYKKYYGAQT